MYKLVEQLAEKVANKYSLDKDALLNNNSKIMYINLGNGIIEFDRNNHLSKCITQEKEKVAVFDAIQTLLKYIH